MARKDLHDRPFDEGTKAKLEIFEDYAQAWIPTFVMRGVSPILIADFFAGTGYDKNQVAGSPIRILEKLSEQAANMRSKGVKVILCLNEFSKRKFELLKLACDEFLSKHPELTDLVDLRFYNEDFEVLFPKLLPEINTFPSLVYLDQNGIRYLSSKYFLELEKVKQCDFLYFVSASYIWRFGNTDEFKIHLAIDMDEAKKNPYRLIHRNLLDQLMASLPKSTKLRLYPFSIRKGSNIYGIIFGATHPLAVDKFIEIAWKRDATSGEANFDINEDAKKDQLGLFEPPKLKKIEVFQQRLEELILDRQLTNNVETYDYAIAAGHPGRHAAEVLRRLKKEKKVSYNSPSPLINYQAVYKDKRKVDYEVML
jgi:three-Cys-motif partner protein